jgi:hypothetical protein
MYPHPRLLPPADHYFHMTQWHAIDRNTHAQTRPRRKGVMKYKHAGEGVINLMKYKHKNILARTGRMEPCCTDWADGTVLRIFRTSTRRTSGRSVSAGGEKDQLSRCPITATPTSPPGGVLRRIRLLEYVCWPAGTLLAASRYSTAGRICMGLHGTTWPILCRVSSGDCQHSSSKTSIRAKSLIVQSLRPFRAKSLFPTRIIQQTDFNTTAEFHLSINQNLSLQ